MENRLELAQKQTLSGKMIQSVMVLQMNMQQLQSHIITTHDTVCRDPSDDISGIKYICK